MLTIIEGPDGGGKSSLAEALATHYRTNRIHHHGPYKGLSNPAIKYYASVKRGQRADRHLIMDRSWVSEPIYGQAVRHGANRIGTALRRMLERVALSGQGLIVYAFPSYETCLANIKDRDKDAYLLHRPGLFREVYDGYHGTIITPASLSHVVFDYEHDNLKTLTQRIDALRPPVNPGPGIGAWCPGKSILIVGERANQANGAPTHPFVSIQRGNVGCSAWLAEQLEAGGLPEHRLYWVNALTPDNRYTDPSFIEHLRPRAVISLGRMAKVWCERMARVDSRYHHTYPHPQYWKRFKTKLDYPLLTDLRKGAYQ